MTYTLTLPTVPRMFSKNILLRRYEVDAGQALLITGTTGTVTEWPSQTQIAAADFYFPGGHLNELSGTEYAAVVAAGYSQYVVTT